MSCFSWAVFRSAQRESTKADVPATYGDDADVPVETPARKSSLTLYPPLGRVDAIAQPGAPRCTDWLPHEDAVPPIPCTHSFSQRLSLLSVLATEITLGAL